jgi:DNA-binding LacI/PurR family transcriptional regulator
MDSKARVIYQDLLTRIVQGDLSGKTSLPTETVLAEQYHCSRPTLRKALNELKQTGCITSVRGSGAYIKARPDDPAAQSGSLFGLIFPNLGQGYFFAPLCNQLTQYASLRGDSVVWSGYVSPCSETLKFDIIQICERYIAQKIAGIFFAPFEYHNKGDLINRELISLISNAGIPIVLIDANVDAYPAVNEYDLVSLDHTQAAYILTRHLVEQGYRRIVFLSQPNSHHTIKLRLMGSHEALLDYGLLPEPLTEINVNSAEEVSRFLAEKRPDAVICSNDITAMSFINTLEKLRIRVPDGIAVAGFDHLSGAMSFSRPITSIEQPIASISQTALELMTSRIANPKRPALNITFPGTLVVEATTVRKNSR